NCSCGAKKLRSYSVINFEQ
ncbi:hypothetical protein AVEN_160381-1, partial [Araneus ventricosus]